MVGARRRVLVGPALPRLRVHRQLPAGALRAGRGHRRAGRPRDPAADADPARPLRVQGRRRARADVRLPRRARRLARSSRSSSCRTSGWCARRCCSAWSTPAWRSGPPWLPARLGEAAARRCACCAPPSSCCCSARAWPTPTAILELGEGNIYADDIVLSRTTPYQRIVLTAWKDDLRLFLNSNLQFSSRDEYRYHEALVHPGLAALPCGPARAGARRRRRTRGARDAASTRSVEHVTLVDLDPEMTRLFSTHPELRRLNHDALRSTRASRSSTPTPSRGSTRRPSTFDFAIVDFPDPSNFSLGKLYTTTFYRLLTRRLSPDGLFVVQSTSPLFARQVVLVHRQRRSSTPASHATPYHVYVPSFGEWGFVLAGRGTYTPPTSLPDGLRFLTPAALARAVRLPGRHGARGRRAEPPQHAGAGAVLRGRVEGDQSGRGPKAGFKGFRGSGGSRRFKGSAGAPRAVQCTSAVPPLHQDHRCTHLVRF